VRRPRPLHVDDVAVQCCGDAAPVVEHEDWREERRWRRRRGRRGRVGFGHVCKRKKERKRDVERCRGRNDSFETELEGRGEMLLIYLLVRLEL